MSARNDESRLTLAVVILGVALGCLSVPRASAAAEMTRQFSVDQPISPQPAAAEETSTIGEIIVTAQRRQQSIQDVGVSITAVSSEQIRQFGITSSKDIAQIAPGVVFEAGEGGGGIENGLTIRGISQSDFSPIQESPNSIYLDDVYISSPNAAGFMTYDLDRIEVLRGPQGTLFGRASSGGLVNYISKQPTDAFDAYAQIGYGSYADRWFEGAVGGPLADGIRGRLSYRWEEANGYMENRMPGGQDTFATHAGSVRGQLAFDVTSTLTGRISASYDWQPRHSDGMYRSTPAHVGPNGQPALLPADVDVYGTGAGNDATGYRDPYPSAWQAAFNSVGYSLSDKYSSTVYFDWKLAAATISSVTNFTKFRSSYNEDTDGGPVDFAQFPIDQNLTQWSQEIRANGSARGVQWTSGVFYLDTNQHVEEEFTFPALSGSSFAYDAFNPVHQTLKSIGVFGQTEYKFSDKWRGTVGARYTHDDKVMNEQNYFYELGNGYSGGSGSTVYSPPLETFNFSEATVGSLAHESEGMWSGKLQLDYLPTDHSLYYASISRGVKGPGFNMNLGGSLSDAQTPFKSEHMYAYETGMKLDLLDRRVRLNGSVYYYDYYNFQGFGFNGLVGQVGNYRGSFDGGELELIVSPERTMTVQLGVAYLESLLRDVPTAYSGIHDEHSVEAPRWTLNGAARKAFQFSSGNELSLQWSFNYLSSRYSSVDNNFATFVPGSFIHNARVAYKLEASGIEIAAFINNISNVARMEYSYDLISSTGSLLRTYDKPRWLGFSVRKSF
ncbi:MAG: iron complex outerrane recepter protein [Gammaproteobacteria bacterium]|jgi:iron complex outermembrane receptor protein|nr:iron complex outerrane recepter protein [Gammaproteobacteria bacterium]